MTMTADEAVALARRLVEEVEAQMLATDPDDEPFELVVLQAERADMLKLLEQTERVAAMRARQVEAGPHLEGLMRPVRSRRRRLRLVNGFFSGNFGSASRWQGSAARAQPCGGSG